MDISHTTSVPIASGRELFRQTWHVVSSRIKTLSLFEIIKWIPSLIFMVLFAVGVVSVHDINQALAQSSFKSIAFIFALVSVFLQLAMVIAQIFVLGSPNPVSVKETLPVVKKRFLPFLGYSVLNSLIIIGIILLFALPLLGIGIFSKQVNFLSSSVPLTIFSVIYSLVGLLVVVYISVRLTFTGILAVIEPHEHAIKRSWQITRGKMKVLLARLAVLFIVSILIYLVFAFIVSLFSSLSNPSIIGQIIQLIGTFIGTIVGVGYNTQLLRQLEHTNAVQVSSSSSETV